MCRGTSGGYLRRGARFLQNSPLDREGDNESALIVQFDEPEETNPGAIVWGYRWPKGEERTSDEMIRAIARESSDLVILVQYTGGMGSTLDGIGYSPDINATLEGVWFDYDSAVDDGNISFGYIFPNTGMGQTSAPGDQARDLSYDAIAAAAESHVIEHPLNAHEYGYPAYDYDHWKLRPYAHHPLFGCRLLILACRLVLGLLELLDRQSWRRCGGSWLLRHGHVERENL